VEVLLHGGGGGVLLTPYLGLGSCRQGILLGALGFADSVEQLDHSPAGHHSKQYLLQHDWRYCCNTIGDTTCMIYVFLWPLEGATDHNYTLEQGGAALLDTKPSFIKISPKMEVMGKVQVAGK